MHNIPDDLLKALHDYLLTRPMGEVEGLVVGIRSRCAPIKDAEDD